MSQDLSPPEMQLMVELAVGIARRLATTVGGPEAGYPEPGYVWHGASSDFENGCAVLWHLGAAQAAYGGDQPIKNLRHDDAVPAVTRKRGFPPYFRPLAPDEVRATLGQGLPDDSPSLEEMLSAYIGLVCDYGAEGSKLSSERDPFLPPEQFRREIEALERLGYLERRGREVLWTDKMAPTMQAAWLWQEDGRSRHSVEEEALEQECAAALAATPAFTKWRLRRAARRSSELDFATILRDRFGGLYWTKNPDGSPRPSSSVALLKAVRRALRQGS